jgi:hypothetical protein
MRLVRREDEGLARGWRIIRQVADMARGGHGPISGLTLEALFILRQPGLRGGDFVLGHGGLLPDRVSEPSR